MRRSITIQRAGNGSAAAATQVAANGEVDTSLEAPDEEGEERPGRDPSSENLLDRLLYKAVLPRYAFPTDVASFHVFDPDRSTYYRPAFRFTPSQGLPDGAVTVRARQGGVDREQAVDLGGSLLADAERPLSRLANSEALLRVPILPLRQDDDPGRRERAERRRTAKRAAGLEPLAQRGTGCALRASRTR